MAQSQNESPSQLAERACARLRRLAAKGTRLYGAAIATGDSAEPDFAVSRCAMARTIAVSMREAEASGKRLWLVASEHAGPGIRHHLLTLAGDLTSQVADPELTVSVRFHPTIAPVRRGERRELVSPGKKRTV